MLGVLEVTRCLSLFRHVTHSSFCTNSITSLTISSARERGIPKKTWFECVKADMKMCSLGSRAATVPPLRNLLNVFTNSSNLKDSFYTKLQDLIFFFLQIGKIADIFSKKTL